jgi:hypothetical protein
MKFSGRVTPAALASAFERNVLLIDAVEARQLARAAAMRQAGATVQCVASGASARAVWKPGSHQLVIIELDGAGADARQFYDYARSLCSRQAFAFYIDEPPYLSSTPDGGAKVAQDDAAAARPGRARRKLSFAEARQQMTTARTTGRPRRSGTPARPSFADAVKAAEAAAKNAQ